MNFPFLISAIFLGLLFSSNGSRADTLSSYKPTTITGERHSITPAGAGNGNYLVRVNLTEKSVLDSFSVSSSGGYSPALLTFKLWSNVAGAPATELMKATAPYIFNKGTVSFSLNSMILDAGIYWMGLSGDTVLGWLQGTGAGNRYVYELRGDTPFFNHTQFGIGLAYNLEGSAYKAVPVPGPEAGAGLGALAMLGVAYWAKRRRNDKAIAA